MRMAAIPRAFRQAALVGAGTALAAVGAYLFALARSEGGAPDGPALWGFGVLLSGVAIERAAFFARLRPPRVDGVPALQPYGPELERVVAMDAMGWTLALGGLALTLALLLTAPGRFPPLGKAAWAVVPLAFFAFVRLVPVQALADRIYDPFDPPTEDPEARERLRKAFLDHRGGTQDMFLRAWAAIALLVAASWLGSAAPAPPAPPAGTATAGAKPSR